VEKIFLTNDLTEKVLEEAIASKASFILTYHPLIFAPLKRLTRSNVKERIVVRAIEERIAVYSPHTSFDSVAGGVNDWLAEGLGEGTCKVIQQFTEASPTELKLVVFVPEEKVEEMREALSACGAGNIGNYSRCSFAIPGTGSFLGNEESKPVVGAKEQLETVKEIRLEMVCNRSKLSEISETIRRVHPYETPAWEVYQLEPIPVASTGQGRIVTLKEKVPLSVMIERIKKHLGLNHVRVAVGSNTKSIEEIQIRTIALCAGAGETVIGKARADLYLTGEMRHHEVLAAVEKGVSVILCEHSNTERGYLVKLSKTLEKLFEGKLAIQVSVKDADPLVVV
jgi:dinuclear metal center YbgI/SA1388 family protein